MEFEQDALHANNPQYCIEYVHEIFEHLIASENKLLPCSTYMDTVSSILSSLLFIQMIFFLCIFSSKYNHGSSKRISLRLLEFDTRHACACSNQLRAVPVCGYCWHARIAV